MQPGGRLCRAQPPSPIPFPSSPSPAPPTVMSSFPAVPESWVKELGSREEQRHVFTVATWLHVFM